MTDLSIIIIWRLTGVFWEADGERRLAYLLFEQVLLVQEQNDASVGEPLVVTNRIEQFERFLHAVLQLLEKGGLLTVLEENHVILKA